MSCTTTNFIQSNPSPFVYQARQREKQREQKDIIRVKRGRERETRDKYNLNMGREDTL
jgi:hypothetical protein